MPAHSCLIQCGEIIHPIVQEEYKKVFSHGQCLISKYSTYHSFTFISYFPVLFQDFASTNQNVKKECVGEQCFLNSINLKMPCRRGGLLVTQNLQVFSILSLTLQVKIPLANQKFYKAQQMETFAYSVHKYRSERY